MANEYYERLSEMNPGDLADGLAMEAEFDAISQGFSKLPTPHTGGQGFDGPVRVGDAVNTDEAVSLGQLNAAIGEAVLLPIATYGNLSAAAWGTLPSNTYLLFGTGAQFSNTPYTLVAGSTYYLQVRHVIGGGGVSIYHDQLSLASTDDASNVDLRRLFVRTGSNLAAAISGGWAGFSLKKAALTALESLIPSADRLAYYTDSGAAALTTLTAFARTLLDDADAAAALVTLGAFPRAGGGVTGDFWSASGGYRFGMVKHLGSHTDGKSCLILLAKKYVGTLLGKTGFNGRILFSRGSSIANHQTDHVDLSVVTAHNQNMGRMFRRSGTSVTTSAKIVEVTYNGGVYYALYRAAASMAEVVAIGQAFDDTLPTLIPNATGYSLTDVVATEEDYHRGSVLGEVSQNSGVPTGALIEEGSNANGYYWKFAGGMAITLCALTISGAAVTATAGNLFQTADVLTIQLPITLNTIIRPALEVLYASGGMRPFPVLSSISASSVSFVLQCGGSVASFSGTAYAIVIGRWY
ncbi:hypothetical protein [Aeromonas sp. ASNIH1]|uniref:hypothetical protein n=1 Tax=Aeromonas sp. ASNIH1 TaxID=1636606 RepID=UPI000CDBAD56|nr:hypothetical protein [Aeromonas sp. ASNIH1]AUZ80858.1 hypothetical protein C2U37_15290 [Aeromonas sp. ASNIH1]